MAMMSKTMTQCSIPCTRQPGWLLGRRIKVSRSKTGGIKISTEPETNISLSIYGPWNPELWFWNALTFETVSPSRVIVHWTAILMSHQGAAGNHRFYLFVWEKVTNRWDVRSMVFPVRSAALLIAMTLISWIKLDCFLRFFREGRRMNTF